jgi:antitoxin PrlF
MLCRSGPLQGPLGVRCGPQVQFLAASWLLLACRRRWRPGKGETPYSWPIAAPCAMATLTITAKGQVTLRRELLRHLGVKPGEQIEVSTLPGGRIEVRAAQPSGSIEAFIGRLAGRTAKVASLDEIQEAAAAGWAGEP